MPLEYKGKDRRKFLRYSYSKPMKFGVIDTLKDKTLLNGLMDAISKNLSASGILFITNVNTVPNISSLLALDLDYKTVNICSEIESSALILKNKVIGRVVRIEDNEDGTCDIGVAFVRKTDPLMKDLKSLENLA